MTIPFEFTATDSCGNQHSMVGTVIVIDTTAPLVATPPQDLTVHVGANTDNDAKFRAWLQNNGGMVTEDRAHPRRMQTDASIDRVARESFAQARVRELFLFSHVASLPFLLL